MIDFKKLNDPAVREQMKKNREDLEKKQADKDRIRSKLINELLIDKQKDPEYYTAWDHKFIESISTQVMFFSDKQEAQLARLAEKMMNR